MFGVVEDFPRDTVVVTNMAATKERKLMTERKDGDDDTAEYRKDTL
jgi:hypothetical protein